MAGGFLGVDIFFVISGYLVTYILVSEPELNSKSLTSFYQRRAFRLLPILFVTLFTTSVFAWRYLLPDDFVSFAWSVLSTLGFGSNFWFYAQDNYHAAESAARPLLHTWSLGVEEQFYLIFPAILYVLRSRSLKVTAAVLTLIWLISFSIAVTLSIVAPEAGFYLLPSRFWELLSGSLLAIYCIRAGGNISPTTSLSNLMSVLGFAALIYSVFRIDTQELHPSFITLIPILGSVILILFAPTSKIANMVLSNRVSSYLGRISYSLYLWHFPVFAFYYIKRSGETATYAEIAEMCSLVILISILGHHIIEKPLRRPHAKTIKLIGIFLFVLACGLALFSSSVIRNNGYENRLGELKQIFDGTSRDESFLYKDGERCFFKVNNRNSCYFENLNGGKKLINMGDSHANAISRPLANLAKNNGMNFYNMILSHCPYIIDAWRNTGFKAKCETTQMDAIQEYVRQIEPAVIVYTVRFPMYLNSRFFDNGEGGVEHSLFFPFYPSPEAQNRGDTVPDLIIKTLQEMAELGHTVVLVYPIPEVGWHVPKLIKTKLDDIPRFPLEKKRKAFEKLSITTDYEVYKRRTRFTKSILEKAKHPNIINVYPEKLFCSNSTGRCITHNKESIFYYDDDHLSQAGATMLVNKIRAKLSLTEK